MNRIRRIVITFLIVIAVAGAIHFYSKPVRHESAAADAIEVAPPPAADGPVLKAAAPETMQIKKILTLYFFPDNAPDNESFIRKAVEHSFAAEIKSGAVVLKVIDANSPERRQLIQAFKPVFPAIVLAVVSNGKINEWQTITPPPDKGRPDANTEDITKTIREYLEKCTR